MKNVSILFLMIILIVYEGYGKTKVVTPQINVIPITNVNNIGELEKRVTPFFESLLTRRFYGKKKPIKNNSPISEDEIVFAMKISHKLSPSFQKLYKKATSISDSFNTYISPSGHFELYYTTIGINGVDSTDNYRYDSINWRIKINEPNGIPDYIDECAFSLDSCWSMMIEKFGFPSPLPYKDEKHPSDLYKVVVEMQEESYYGFTYLFEPLPDRAGYRSCLSIRNNWSDPEWSELGYDKNPINGIRVTCAHEFFHAIQYGMSHQVTLDVFLDDFPLSWTEGTAVCMEELAFDSINDYHQYAKTYFNNPSISFLSNPISDIVYTNSILLIYITKHFPPDGKASFIRIMHENNYKERSGFHINLFNTCEYLSKDWVEILHSFHCNSYFTDKFCDTSKFIPDASYFKMKTPQIYSIQKPITKKISSNSAIHIGIMPSQNHGDSLKITIYGDPSKGSADIRCSIMQQQDEKITFIPFYFDKNGNGSYTIYSWKELQMATIIITNGDPLREREVKIEFNIDSTETNSNVVTSKEILVYPNIISKRKNNKILYVKDSTLKEIYIYSLSGILMKKISAKNMNLINGRFTFDCSDFLPGRYLLLISKGTTGRDSINYLRQWIVITP